MSDLAAIYGALALLPVSVSGVTPGVYYGATLPASIDSARLPCRLLLPPGTNLDATSLRGRASVPLALGGGQRIAWRIDDLLLWEAVGRGRGLPQHTPLLMDYCAAYADAARQNAALVRGTTQATLEQVAFEVGAFAYPEGSAAHYFGARVTVLVREIS